MDRIHQVLTSERIYHTIHTFGTGITFGAIRWFPWQLVLIGGVLCVVLGGLGHFYFGHRADRLSLLASVPDE